MEPWVMGPWAHEPVGHCLYPDGVHGPLGPLVDGPWAHGSIAKGPTIFTSGQLCHSVMSISSITVDIAIRVDRAQDMSPAGKWVPMDN